MHILIHLHDTCICPPAQERTTSTWMQTRVRNNTLPQLVTSCPSSWLAPVAPVDCILVRRLANALNSPLLQSTASQTKCSFSSVSRRVFAYAKAFALVLATPPPHPSSSIPHPRFRCAAVTAVAHAVQPVALSFRIWMRFVFYFALECSSGREAPQDADADALAAHVVAVLKRGWSDCRGERGGGKVARWAFWTSHVAFCSFHTWRRRIRWPHGGSFAFKWLGSKVPQDKRTCRKAFQMF